MRHIRVKGGGINVAETGGRDGTVVVFVNSLGTDLRIWDEVVERLPPGLHIVRTDKRGHGLSSIAPPSRTIAAHAADLAGALDALGVGRCLVVGLSIGGMIAQVLAASRPDLVGALLLLDTAHRVGTREVWDARIAAVRDGGIGAIADAVTERWFSAHFWRDHQDVVAAWRVLLERMSVDGYVAACEALRDGDLTAISPGIRVPTTFAVGSEDTSTPPDLVRHAADLVPGASFHLIDGAAHLPPLDRPDAVAALVRAQLGDLARG
jgi:3-oxoadipate enol-lactonase